MKKKVFFFCDLSRKCVFLLVLPSSAKLITLAEIRPTALQKTVNKPKWFRSDNIPFVMHRYLRNVIRLRILEGFGRILISVSDFFLATR